MRFLGIAALAAMLLALVGCGSDHGGGPTNMRLKLVSLVPDAGLSQLYWKGAPVSPRPLEYREDSGYQSRDSGRGNADLYVIDLGTIASEFLWLTTDGEYSLFGVGSIALGNTELVRVIDDTRPAVDKYKVRVFHGTSAAPPVDVYITAVDTDLEDVAPNFPSMSFRMASGYVERGPGTYRVRFTAPGTKTVLLDTGVLEGLAGQVFTVAVSGEPAVGAPLRTLLLTDRR